MLRQLTFSALVSGLGLAAANAQTCPSGTCQDPAAEPTLIPGGAAVTDVAPDVDQEESGRRPGRGDWMARLDTDGDGSIQFSEIPDGDRAQRLRDLDTDGDEVITADEFAAGRPSGRRGDRGWSPERFIEQSDSDGDGLVQLSEITDEQRRERVASADTDGDGALSPEEIETFMAANRDRARNADSDRRSFSGDAANAPPSF